MAAEAMSYKANFMEAKWPAGHRVFLGLEILREYVKRYDHGRTVKRSGHY